MCEGMAICSICGQEHPVEDLTRFDGHNLCSDCLRSRTCLCDRCHDRIWRKDDHGEDALTLCAHCAKTYYAHCAACGCFAERELLHYPVSEDQGYCDECFAHYINKK